jgi:hypothetical protein
MIPPRVLLAAPEGSPLAACRDHVARDGFEASVAPGGLECLDALRTAPPDVLVLELDPRWAAGADAERDDRGVPRAPVTFLLSWTGRRRPGGPTALQVSEAFDSPVPPGVLARKIRQLVGRDRREAVAEAR